MVANGISVLATPGLLLDPTRADLDPVATLTVVPLLAAYTPDPTDERQPVDLVLTELLRHGFTPAPQIAVHPLLTLPVLPGWSADYNGDDLRVAEPGGDFYAGNLGPAVPSRWGELLHRRGLLVLLVCTGVDLHSPLRTTLINDAARDGNVIAAQTRLAHRPGAR